MDPCCSAGRFLMTILPKVLWKSPAVLGAPHLTDSNLGEACRQAAPGNSVWCALGAASKLYHFPPATVMRTEEGLSHHLWGQLSCQLLWLASGNSERMKQAVWPGMIWGWGWGSLRQLWWQNGWHAPDTALSCYLITFTLLTRGGGVEAKPDCLGHCS